MKKLFYILFSLVFLLSCNEDSPIPFPDPPAEPEEPTNPEEPSDEKDSHTYIFDSNALPEISIEVPEEEWNKLLAYFDKNNHNEEYVKATFTCKKEEEKETLSEVGLRLRGNTSRRRPEGYKGQTHNSLNPDWHHASFSINFKKYNKEQRFHSTEKLILKWFKDDPMYVRELYCYDLFERFGVWTAPQSSYCRLSIKITGDKAPAYFGVYQMIEPVDEVFLEYRKDKFADSNGCLWKANYGADLKYADRGKMGIEQITLESTYKPVYDLKTNKKQLETAKDQLANFITNLNSKNGTELKAWLTKAMDVELFLKTYAVNVVCGMWDDYWGNSNNFYFYFNALGKFFFIPYDYDNTLGTSLLIEDTGKHDLLNWGKSDAHPMVAKILSIPEYKSLYVGYLHELCDARNDYFEMTRSIERIKKWHSLISPYIGNDTKEDMELKDRPAGWGNCGHYRLLESSNNFFKTRASHLPDK